MTEREKGAFFPRNDKKEAENRRKLKSARLVVRNLPFSSTEKTLKELFSQYGNVLEVNLLKKRDGKLIGCCFIQYDKKVSAAAAISKLSGKPFLGRPIIADWAVPKDKFISNSTSKQETVVVKEEPENELSDEVQIKSESTDIKEEPELSEGDSSERSEDEADRESDTHEVKQEKETDDEVSENESEEDEKPDVKDLKSKQISNDVSEGKTVFIKNLPFSATEDELKECLKKFGRFYYVKICIDPLTEHSRGTAFVKFLTKESAEKCLAAGTEFELNGTVLDPHPAIPRQALDKNERKKKHPTDSRNLFLLKEGVIAAGSKAAEGVSESDMTKRLQLERWKRQIIKDLGKFVSLTRLVVHNLPLSVDDQRFKAIVTKFSPKGATVTEARIMRNLNQYDGKGQAVSKGFGFVSFSNHEDALTTLRLLNNNPSVFKTHRRPIVSFSVESKKAMNIKQKRLEKSKMPKTKTEDPIIKVENKRKRKQKRKNVTNQEGVKVRKTDECKDEKIPFAGITATPGVKKFLNNDDFKKQALLHKSSLKRAKSKLKQKKLALQKQINIKQKNERRQTMKPELDKEFSNLVAKYKSQISMNKVKKWYE